MLKLFLFMFLVIVGKTFAQCLNDCSGYGRCRNENVCECFTGFYELDCSKSIAEIYPAGWIVLRTCFTIWFSFLTILCTFGIINYLKKDTFERKKDNVKTALFNTRIGVLFFLGLFALIDVIYYAIDPNGANRVLPYFVSNFLVSMTLPVIAAVYIFILCYWKAIYDGSVSLLKKNEKLKKVSNGMRDEDLTVENVVESLSRRLGYMRIILLISLAIAFIVQIINNVLSILDANQVFVGIYLAFFALIFLVTTLGFFIWGFKIMKILGSDNKKIAKTTRLVQIQSLLLLIAWTFLMISYPLIANRSPIGLIVNEVFARIVQSITTLSFLYTFLKFDSKNQCFFRWSKVENISNSDVKTGPNTPVNTAADNDFSSLPASKNPHTSIHFMSHDMKMPEN